MTLPSSRPTDARTRRRRMLNNATLGAAPLTVQWHQSEALAEEFPPPVIPRVCTAPRINLQQREHTPQAHLPPQPADIPRDDLFVNGITKPPVETRQQLRAIYKAKAARVQRSKKKSENERLTASCEHLRWKIEVFRKAEEQGSRAFAMAVAKMSATLPYERAQTLLSWLHRSMSPRTQQVIQV